MGDPNTVPPDTKPAKGTIGNAELKEALKLARQGDTNFVSLIAGLAPPDSGNNDDFEAERVNAFSAGIDALAENNREDAIEAAYQLSGLVERGSLLHRAAMEKIVLHTDERVIDHFDSALAALRFVIAEGRPYGAPQEQALYQSFALLDRLASKDTEQTLLEAGRLVFTAEKASWKRQDHLYGFLEIRKHLEDPDFRETHEAAKDYSAHIQDPAIRKKFGNLVAALSDDSLSTMLDDVESNIESVNGIAPLTQKALYTFYELSEHWEQKNPQDALTSLVDFAFMAVDHKEYGLLENKFHSLHRDATDKYFARIEHFAATDLKTAIASLFNTMTKCYERNDSHSVLAVESEKKLAHHLKALIRQDRDAAREYVKHRIPASTFSHEKIFSPLSGKLAYADTLHKTAKLMELDEATLKKSAIGKTRLKLLFNKYSLYDWAKENKSKLDLSTTSAGAVAGVLTYANLAPPSLWGIFITGLTFAAGSRMIGAMTRNGMISGKRHFKRELESKVIQPS